MAAAQEALESRAAEAKVAPMVLLVLMVGHRLAHLAPLVLLPL